jgi:hypothetical protein
MLASACAAPDASPSLAGNPYLSKAELESEPAHEIAMPGAEKLFETGSERFNNITGPEPAFAGAIWGTSEDVGSVYLYYYTELARLGWREEADPIRITVERVAKGWCKPRMHFRLGVFEPENYGRVGVQNGERFATVYQAVLSGIRRECPEPNG